MWHAVRPNIETCPANVVVPQGRSARFDCKASGRPTPDIYWTSGDGQFDSRRNSEDPHYVQLYNNNSLLVQAVRPLHSGTYICHAENIVGQDDCGATLTVQGKQWIRAYYQYPANEFNYTSWVYIYIKHKTYYVFVLSTWQI